jgi:hypothetical protein
MLNSSSQLKQEAAGRVENKVLQADVTLGANAHTCLPRARPSALTDSVLPVPAGPYGLPP